MTEDKRFILYSKKETKKKKLGSFNTYEEACNAAERVTNGEIAYCYIHDKEMKV